MKELLRALRLLRRHKPRLLSKVEHRDRLGQVVLSIATAISSEVAWTSDDPGSQAEHLREISLVLSEIQEFLQRGNFPELDERLIELCDKRADELDASVEEHEEEPVAPSRARDAFTPFDLDRLFADL